MSGTTDATTVAVIRLELELDSEVYPELHSALAAIAREASRAERLRQLAAAGLIWERVRIGGSAARAGLAESPVPDANRVAAIAEPGATSARQAAEVRSAKPAAAAFSYPVLHDVVGVEQPGDELSLCEEQTTLSLLSEEVEDLWRRAAMAEIPRDAVAEPADQAAPALVHKSNSRSRLLRMKERGLFKNG